VSSRTHARRWLILLWFVVVGLPSGADAQDPSVPRAPSTGPGNPATVQTGPATSATTETPPFWVAGVTITSAQRSAFLVLRDDRRRDVGVLTLREGESFGDYRVATIESDRVFFERNGTVVPVVVGRPSDEPKAASGTGRRPIIILGPDTPTPDVPYARPPMRRGREVGVAPAQPDSPPPDPEALKSVLESVVEHPQFQQRLQGRRPLIQRSLELAPPGSQPAPDAPAATPTR